MPTASEWLTDDDLPPEHDDRLVNYDPAMLECRTEHHDWQWRGDQVHERRGNVVIIVKTTNRCTRCPMERYTRWNFLTGRIVGSRQYYDPTGRYKIAGEMVNHNRLRLNFYAQRNPELLKWQAPKVSRRRKR